MLCWSHVVLVACVLAAGLGGSPARVGSCARRPGVSAPASCASRSSLLSCLLLLVLPLAAAGELPLSSLLSKEESSTNYGWQWIKSPVMRERYVSTVPAAATRRIARNPLKLLQPPSGVRYRSTGKHEGRHLVKPKYKWEVGLTQAPDALERRRSPSPPRPSTVLATTAAPPPTQRHDPGPLPARSPGSRAVRPRSLPPLSSPPLRRRSLNPKPRSLNPKPCRRPWRR